MWATTSAARSGPSATCSRRHGSRRSWIQPDGCSRRSSAPSTSSSRSVRPRTPRSASLGSTRTGSPTRRRGSSIVASSSSSTHMRLTPATVGHGSNALTYDNARLPQALIVGGAALGRPDAVAAGLERARVARRRVRAGRRSAAHARAPWSPARRARARARRRAASRRVCVRGGRAVCLHRHRRRRSRTTRATSLRVVPRPKPRRTAALRFATGGCCDGLEEDDVNANEGAESTLAFHRASARAGRRRAPARRPCGSVDEGRVDEDPRMTGGSELFVPAPREPDPVGGGLAVPR